MLRLTLTTLDLQQFQAFGIEPEQKRIVALKSMQHFRTVFEPIAGEVIVCDSGVYIPGRPAQADTPA
jgi:microcystin degradation protein MlrC